MTASQVAKYNEVAKKNGNIDKMLRRSYRFQVAMFCNIPLITIFIPLFLSKYTHTHCLLRCKRISLHMYRVTVLYR